MRHVASGDVPRGIVDRGIVICRDDVVRRIRHVAVVPVRNVRCVVTRSVRRLVDQILGRRHGFRHVVDGVPGPADGSSSTSTGAASPDASASVSGLSSHRATLLDRSSSPSMKPVFPRFTEKVA